MKYWLVPVTPPVARLGVYWSMWLVRVCTGDVTCRAHVSQDKSDRFSIDRIPWLTCLMHGWDNQCTSGAVRSVNKAHSSTSLRLLSLNSRVKPWRGFMTIINIIKNVYVFVINDTSSSACRVNSITYSSCQNGGRSRNVINQNWENTEEIIIMKWGRSMYIQDTWITVPFVYQLISLYQLIVLHDLKVNLGDIWKKEYSLKIITFILQLFS